MMFCYQCEQTTRSPAGIGCTSEPGTCGKDEATAGLQDILTHLMKGIAQYARRARAMGVADRRTDDFIFYGLFTTLTNVNFTATRFVHLIQEASKRRERIKLLYEEAAREQGKTPEILSGPALFQPADSLEQLLRQAPSVAINADVEHLGSDVIGARALILYGMKGVAAYAQHARVLGYQSDEVDAQAEEILDYLASNPTDLDEMLEESLEVGRLNLKVMELLDVANTDSFGAQEITSVRISPIQGKAILVSGHDLHDLKQILEQTKDQGINVYTHGEMLPANAYPLLKAYPHLAGNLGGAWQDQQREFADFPGPIVMTSNCIIEPGRSYKNRIFTLGPVGWPGVRHIDNGDFTPVIQAAKALPGFTADAKEQRITIGFGHHTLLGVADKIVDAVKHGDIRHFFLVGGCDGVSPARNYFTEVADNAPADSVVMTLGCGKYRFNKHEFGDIGGIPRLLDIGQCNDAHSAIRVAGALAEAFNCGVNDLPLSIMLSWFEQKATAIHLSLLALGIKGIKLGPTLPAYLTPTLVQKLQSRFDLDLDLIGEAQADLQAALAHTA
ncbi:MAG: hydroxylamine reductase [Acidithiobacillus ferrooxidans]|jgi:hydroxylamine reductase|nr:hydroxylamine reductase [Acidithiobacillus ferrooxidans]BDB15961.1 hydroxylamine reductase [Acidithiobacillus ferrooxidans]